MLSPVVEVAGSTTDTVASVWSMSRTSVPDWTIDSSDPGLRTTELSSRTAGFARPTTCELLFATHTLPSPRSSFCAVNPDETTAIVATTIAITVPLVAVATRER